MVRIDLRYEGGLRVRATHAPSGTTLLTDAPVDNQGKGESFSPTDLVATALGSCMATLMGIAGQQHGIPLEGTEVRVHKEMVRDPERRIGALEVEIRVPQGIPEDRRTLLERAARTCPVRRSLHPEIATTVRFVWGGAQA